MRHRGIPPHHVTVSHRRRWCPISGLFDQVGPHARSVDDLGLFDAVAPGIFAPIRPTALKGVKLGVARDYWFSGLDAEVERITNAALRKLQDHGVELVEANVPDLADLVERRLCRLIAHDILRDAPKISAQDSADRRNAGSDRCASASPDVKVLIDSILEGRS